MESKLVKVESNTPGEVIRSGCKANVITESDSEEFIRMLKSRNFTPHIYKEELAEKLVVDVYRFYEILKRNIDKIR